MDSRTGAGAARGYLSLFRLGNCAMAAAGVLLSAVVCAGIDGLEDHSLGILLSMAVAALFTAAGNSLNDYYDRETDRVAHPQRPIPSGRVSAMAARSLSAMMFGAAFVLSLFVGLFSILIVISAILIMVWYEKSLKAKGLSGNLAIGWLTGALFLFGGVAVDGLELAWILAALALLATVGREIVKDIEDIEGDKGSRVTLPMEIGKRNAGVAASVSFVAAVALSPVPYLLDLLSVWYIPVVVLSDAIFIYCALIQFRNPRMGQKVAKLAMFVALVAFLLGGVF